MRLWCKLQAKNKKSTSEIQEAACKLLVGHASSSAQFYLFVDILWEKVSDIFKRGVAWSYFTIVTKPGTQEDLK